MIVVDMDCDIGAYRCEYNTVGWDIVCHILREIISFLYNFVLS